MKEVFVYIHIPFCDSKCVYCRFTSVWGVQNYKIQEYVEFLCNEIKNYSFEWIWKLNSIYFGGWTPSILEWKQIEKIINLLKEKINFSEKIEITLESTPKKVTEENLILWKNIWINRLSIWIQTLNEKSLEKIWRFSLPNSHSKPHPNPLLFWGDGIIGFFDNISVDFIIWLPYVKKWEIKKDIEFLINKYSEIKHVSVYMLEDLLYPKDWKNLWIKEENYLWEYIEILEFLEKKWFNRYEISNFAKKWYECNHNKAYWNHKTVFGFWLSAHSYINWTRYSNSDKFRDYYRIPPVLERLTLEDIFLEKVMFQLRTWWIEEKIYKKLDSKNISVLINEWYLKIDNWLLKLENKGILVQDYILGEII